MVTDGSTTRHPGPIAQAGGAGGRAPVRDALVLAVQALRVRLIGARDLINDSTPILAWRRREPDAASGHAPAHHPIAREPARAHTRAWACRVSSSSRWTNATVASSCSRAVRLYDLRARRVRMETAYWGLALSN